MVKVQEKVQELSSWETPATYYQEGQIGNYRLKKSEISKGYHRHYCVNGFTITNALKPLPTMLLQELRNRRWYDWMADVPSDYMAMQKYAAASSGKVLTSGLGLGLLIHELAKNKNVEQVTIVERSPEVRDLVFQYVPQRNTTLVMSDLWDFVKGDNTDWETIIVDIWASRGKAMWNWIFNNQVLPANTYLRDKYPRARLVFHWFQDVSDIKLMEVCANECLR